MGFLSFSFHLTKSCLKILVTIWSVMLSEVSGSSNVCAWVSFSSEILVACLAFLSLVFLSAGRRGTAERAPYMKERLGDLLNMTLACSPDKTHNLSINNRQVRLTKHQPLLLVQPTVGDGHPPFQLHHVLLVLELVDVG